MPDPAVRNHFLTVYNAATNTIVTAIRLGQTQGNRQEHIAMAPDGALIYVINNYYEDLTVSVVSTQTNAVVATLPESVTGAHRRGRRGRAGTADRDVLFTFTIGPACTVPASPNVSGGVAGGTASVTWPPVPGATSYILSAGTAQGGTQFLPPANIGANTGASASGLPPGFTAWVRVIAVNACGQGSGPRHFYVQ